MLEWQARMTGNRSVGLPGCGCCSNRWLSDSSSDR